ncbi:Fic family protein, partial [Candidatus Methanophagaceae archaeon]
MATVKKKLIGRQTYYYLEHTFRYNGKIQKKERYLGKKVPENIDELKKDFFVEIYKEKWYPLFDRIKELYSTERRLMPKTAKEKEIQDFAIRFTYDTNRIEGSKLTLRDTADLLEKGLTPKAKPLDDVKEAEAHEKVFYDMLTSKKDLSLQIVLYWHKFLFENTKSDIAGIIRQHQVAIAGSKFMPPFPAEIYPLLSEFFKWYNKNKDKIHPVELAALVHIKFVTIHPFTDGNGRLSRLMMNFVLHKYEFPLLNIHYVIRTGYYNALERAQIKKQDNVFVQWLFRRYVKEYG